MHQVKVGSLEFDENCDPQALSFACWTDAPVGVRGFLLRGNYPSASSFCLLTTNSGAMIIRRIRGRSKTSPYPPDRLSPEASHPLNTLRRHRQSHPEKNRWLPTIGR